MLTEHEKIIVERFMELHKKMGGTVTYEMRHPFVESLGYGFFDLNPIIDKSVALELIQYKLSDRTGITTLTKKGWDFKNFEDFEKRLLSQQEIDIITIEKLKTDLVNSKRQSKMFIPLTILTFILGFFSIYKSIKSEKANNSIEQLQLKQNKIDSVLNSLNYRIDKIRQDTLTSKLNLGAKRRVP